MQTVHFPQSTITGSLPSYYPGLRPVPLQVEAAWSSQLAPGSGSGCCPARWFRAAETCRIRYCYCSHSDLGPGSLAFGSWICRSGPFWQAVRHLKCPSVRCPASWCSCSEPATENIGRSPGWVSTPPGYRFRITDSSCCGFGSWDLVEAIMLDRKILQFGWANRFRQRSWQNYRFNWCSLQACCYWGRKESGPPYSIRNLACLWNCCCSSLGLIHGYPETSSS